MQRDIKQAALPVLGGYRQAFNRGCQQLAVFNDAHGAATLCHQHASIGQKCHAPGVMQPLYHLGGADLVVLGIEYGLRACRACQKAGSQAKGGSKQGSDSHEILERWE